MEKTGLQVDVALESVARMWFKEEYAEAEREAVSEAQWEITGRREDNWIPIFVCMVAYPGVKCPLHVFEPRYRLMMRRCMQSGQRAFGMCSSNGYAIAELGTLLYINSQRLLPDGRSYIDGIGIKRFRVLETDSRDGYTIGRVEYLTDTDLAPSPTAPPESALSNCLRLAEALETILTTRLLDGVPPTTRAAIIQNFGDIPHPDRAAPHALSNIAFWAVALLQADVSSGGLLLYAARGGARGVLRYWARRAYRAFVASKRDGFDLSLQGLGYRMLQMTKTEERLQTALRILEDTLDQAPRRSPSRESAGTRSRSSSRGRGSPPP